MLTGEAGAETVQQPPYMLNSGGMGSDPDNIDRRQLFCSAALAYLLAGILRDTETASTW
jgi:hypothetical protein